MASSGNTHQRVGIRTKITFLLITLFIATPIILFVFIAAKGFITQATDMRPEEVVATSITKSSATITWTTGKGTQGVVEYGTTPQNLVYFGPETEPKKEHSVPLTLLSPATTYYFRLNIDGVTFDNEGVPWTFTTKTKDGSDVAEAVKGIATRNISGTSPTPTLAGCSYETCKEIQDHLGRGCGSADYLKCLANKGVATSGTTQRSAIISTTPNTSYVYATATPTPTPIHILTPDCKVKYLQMQPGKNCTDWSWEPYATKSVSCRDAFYQYVFQCSSKNFTSTNVEDIATWYYNNAISNMSTNSLSFTSVPSGGSTVYCQVRAEDEKGNATAWTQASAVCTYTTTPTPTP